MTLAGSSDVRLVGFLDRIAASYEPEPVHDERPSRNPFPDGLVHLVCPVKTPGQFIMASHEIIAIGIVIIVTDLPTNELPSPTTDPHRPHQQPNDRPELVTHDGQPSSIDILNFDHLAPTNH